MIDDVTDAYMTATCVTSLAREDIEQCSSHCVSHIFKKFLEITFKKMSSLYILNIYEEDDKR